MQGISRNIVISVMLHSVLLAAVFAIGNSSMQQTKRLLIVSLFDDWQKGETAGPAQGSSNRLTRRAPADSLFQGRPEDRLLTAQARNTAAETQAPGAAAPAAQAPLTLPEKGETQDIHAALAGRSHSGTTDGHLRSASSGSTATSSGKYGPETGGSGSGSAGREHQTDKTDPALGRKIREILQANIVYPYLARKKRIEGTVLAEFRLNNSGMPEHMRIVRTSHYAILDEAAKETIQKAAPFPAQNRRIEIPITFRLREAE